MYFEKENPMRNRSQLALGIILILLGALFIAQRQVPAIHQMTYIFMSWPLNVVAIGTLIFLIGLLLGAPGMSVPAVIVAGIGGILYYQKFANDYTSWSYMWTLIPGFVGLGEIISGLLTRSNYKARNGVNLIVASAVMFIVFAAIFGKLNILGPFGPAVLLILVGV
jgi:hypothetical protein